MPNYDYECQSCGHRFEVFQSMNDAKLEHCPQVGCSGTVKRLLGTGAGLIFKGAGFYQTDYRSSSYQAGVKADGAASKPDSTAKPESSSKSGESSSASSSPAAPAGN